MDEIKLEMDNYVRVYMNQLMRDQNLRKKNLWKHKRTNTKNLL